VNRPDYQSKVNTLQAEYHSILHTWVRKILARGSRAYCNTLLTAAQHYLVFHIGVDATGACKPFLECLGEVHKCKRATMTFKEENHFSLCVQPAPWVQTNRSVVCAQIQTDTSTGDAF
jgi:hypothetical protein